MMFFRHGNVVRRLFRQVFTLLSCRACYIQHSLGPWQSFAAMTAMRCISPEVLGQVAGLQGVQYHRCVLCCQHVVKNELHLHVHCRNKISAVLVPAKSDIQATLLHQNTYSRFSTCFKKLKGFCDKPSCLRFVARL